MDYKEQFYAETTFGSFTDTDETVAFYLRVNALLQPSFTVVNFGCGRGIHLEDPVQFRRDLSWLKGKASAVIGVDVDEAGRSNPSIDEFRLLEAGRPWPIADRSVHMIVCDYVMEHLPDPCAFIQEASRVLVSGGYVCIRTTNALSYVGIISRILPSRYHKEVLSKIQPERKEEDVFPTLHRCNTVWALRHLLASAHFRSAVYGYDSEPRYLNIAKIAYAFGVAHQKLAPGCLKVTIFAFGQTQTGQAGGPGLRESSHFSTPPTATIDLLR
jgi:SAM-dependent methyltransferase